jgi:hypothetical protein
MQKAGSVSIDSIVLQPAHVRPGSELFAQVKLRNTWLPERTPRIFFKADNQLHAAKASPDGNTWEVAWVAGERDGRFPVTLILEWPLYGRSETALLGTYLVDGTPPLFELDLRGVQMYEGTPLFRDELVIVPRLLVRKPLERWRLAFQDAGGLVIGADEGEGNLPEAFIWQGRNSSGGRVEDGIYQVMLEAWDKAGNSAKASQEVRINRRSPELAVAVARSGRDMQVDLEHDGKVPLAYWRMEMWTREGKFLTQSEGKELPAKIGIELPTAEDQEVQGFLVVQDVLGNKARRKIEDLLVQAKPQAGAMVEEEKTSSFSETWVDEF